MNRPVTAAPEDSPKKAARTSWRVRLLLLCGSTLLVLLLAEGGLRLLNRAAPTPRRWIGEYENAQDATFSPCPTLGWRMPANAAKKLVMDGRSVWYHANAEGFRVDPDRPPREGERAIAFMGDSQVWGWGVASSETLGAVVTRHLEETCALNFAMPGFGLDQIWLATRHCALPMKPALVVVGVYPPDFDRSLHAYRPWERLTKPAYVLDRDRLRPQVASDRPGSVGRLLEHHSRVWTLVKNAHHRMGRRFDTGTWWRLNRAILDRLHEDCRTQDVPLLLVRLPEQEPESFPMLASWAQSRKAHYLDAAALDFGPEDWQSNGHLEAPAIARIGDLVADYVAETFSAFERR